ncbi:uncharacterized protein VDAG_09580 [Verticillium dahliae VdLs.17]|uniref:Protein kinase domain-containing protein n=1 Tax=Verticillium dahliae (strain VdLs.17 / ATCC MYA-4575 / FGSC 10137) TaxID=498257 RepID=G2XHT0_VERDV|nr:uncharacterized protein VDAG_09580 [Verticillium dahliae VdLs.17]EGY19378.1 hypothetical protein VDAG_09580 [Verticillium dahliae VdLs.17]KAH6708585.1 kinase-like domain-containing protein [Verticillium dahliae]
MYSSVRPGQRQHIVSPESVFEVSGPNGRHACFVLELMGPNLNTLLRRHPLFCVGKPWRRRFPKQVAKQIPKDMLPGVQSLHDCGIVHGDLHPGNILVYIPPLEEAGVSEESLAQTPDEGTLLIRRDGLQDYWASTYLLEPAPLIDHVVLDRVPLVKITDLCAETILGLDLGKRTDIWCVGCLVFELITGRQLFVRLEALQGDESDETTNDEHLIQLSQVLGPMPTSLFTHWQRGPQYYGLEGELIIDDGESDVSDDEKSSQATLESGDNRSQGNRVGSERGSPLATAESFVSLEQQLRKCKPDDMEEAEEAIVLELLRWILQYDPEKRPSAEEILTHPWFL